MECKQKVLILNSSEKFIISLANIRHVHFNMVNSTHRYCRCLLIKIYTPYRIVFTFHENLLDEKLPEMKRTFLKGKINNYFFILLMKNFLGVSKNDFWASRCWLQLARRASCKINFLCTLTWSNDQSRHDLSCGGVSLSIG